MKVREGGRSVLAHALIAVAVTADGLREVLGIDFTSFDHGSGWLAFLRSLVARSLTGVALLTSDAHARLGRGGRRDTAWRELAGDAAPFTPGTCSTKVPRCARPRCLPCCGRPEGSRPGSEILIDLREQLR